MILIVPALTLIFHEKCYLVRYSYAVKFKHSYKKWFKVIFAQLSYTKFLDTKWTLVHIYLENSLFCNHVTGEGIQKFNKETLR